MKTLSRKLLSRLAKASPTKEQSNEARGNSGIELCNLTPESTRPDGGSIPQSQWISLLTPGSSRPIISGLARLEDSDQAIALDPQLLYPYSRKDV